MFMLSHKVFDIDWNHLNNILGNIHTHKIHVDPYVYAKRGTNILKERKITKYK